MIVEVFELKNHLLLPRFIYIVWIHKIVIYSFNQFLRFFSKSHDFFQPWLSLTVTSPWKLRWHGRLQTASRLHDNFIRLYDNFVRLHDNFIRLYDNFVRLYDNFVRLHDNFVRLYDNFVRLHDNFIRLYDNFVRLHDNFIRLYDNFIRLYDNFVPLDGQFLILSLRRPVASLALPRFEYGNVTHAGIPVYQYHRLKSVMNIANKLIYRRRR